MPENASLIFERPVNEKSYVMIGKRANAASVSGDVLVSG